MSSQQKNSDTIGRFVLGFTLTTIISGVGILLNFMVLTANEGKMPVWRGAVTYYDSVANKLTDYHIVMTHKTKLNFLGDIINFGVAILSIGDILMTVFIPLTFLQFGRLLIATRVNMPKVQTDE